jgi:hypothetical protein
MSAAAQDAALAAMWAAADRRRIGWILAYLREGVVHRDHRDYAEGLLPQFCPVRARTGRPRSKIYVKLSYPFFDPQHGHNTNVVLRAHDAQGMLERVRRAQSESPRERQ